MSAVAHPLGADLHKPAHVDYITTLAERSML